jgi:hypothetical protein
MLKTLRHTGLITLIVVSLLTACSDKEDKPSPQANNAQSPQAEGSATSIDAVVAALNPAATLGIVEERVRPAIESQIAVLYRAPEQGSLRAKLPELTATLKATLQEEFTPTELDAFATFLQTPAGQNFAQKLPRIKENIENAAMQHASQLLSDLMQQQIHRQQDEASPADDGAEVDTTPKEDEIPLEKQQEGGKN